MPIKPQTKRQKLKEKYKNNVFPEEHLHFVSKRDRYDGIKRWMKRDGELYEMHYDYDTKENAERVEKNLHKVRPSTKTFIVKRLNNKGKLKHIVYERRSSKMRYKKSE